MRGMAASAPEAGAARRSFTGSSPVRPISLHRASIRARVSSTRSWGKCAHIQGFKGAACAPTADDTERGRRGARRRAGASAAACAQKKNNWDDDGQNLKMKITSLPARKRLW
jgi:hypothetical protein